MEPLTLDGLFKIPAPILPTREEMEQTSAEWVTPLLPCLYENWPDELKEFSFHTELVKLSRAELEAFCRAMDGKGVELDSVAHRLDRVLNDFPDGCFAKLSSRSPKDGFGYSDPPFLTGGQIVDAFSASMRVNDDIVHYITAPVPCYILVRSFFRIPKWQEFRCFIRNREVIGVSQYHYDAVFPELVGRAEEMCNRVKEYLADRLIPHLHVGTVVVDLWMADDPVLIEINPYGLSDPCLFTYKELAGAKGEYRIKT